MVKTVYIPLELDCSNKKAPITAIGVLYAFLDKESAVKVSENVIEVEMGTNSVRNHTMEMARRMVHFSLGGHK